MTGCSSHNSANKQMTTQQTKVKTPTASPSPNAATPASKLTQASSLSTTDAGKSSIKINQDQTKSSNWMDWFNSNYGPVKKPAGQPANPQPSVNPQPTDNPQESANSPQFAQQVLDLVNQERSKAGLKPLSMISGLTKVAMAKAQDMYNNNYFDHQSPTYGSPFDMMKSFGITYNSAGENIAKGQTSPTEVMNQWMNSPGHRANILNTTFTQIGIAFYNKEWVQEFTG